MGAFLPPFQTPSDVISEAFKLLAARADKIEQLRQKIAVGTAKIANGQITDGELVCKRPRGKENWRVEENKI